MVNEDIINMLNFTFFDNIYKWGEKNYMIIPIVLL
jgi:hypothetical protein